MILLSPINGNNAQCDVCGELFKRDLDRLRPQTYHTCSKKCRNNYKKQLNTHICEQCGVSFYRPKGHAIRTNHKFCSRKCSNAFQSGPNHHHFRSEPYKNCPVCGIQIKRCGLIYCSNKCKAQARRGENHPRFSQTPVNCAECGEVFTLQPSLIKETNFCCKDCQNVYHSKRMSGRQNGRYKHGQWVGEVKEKLIYDGFTLKLRKEIRKRDNDTCVVCGITKEQHGMNMHVHHIDYNKTNNHPANLCCVCRYCHGKIHGDETKWEKILSGQFA